MALKSKQLEFVRDDIPLQTVIQEETVKVTFNIPKKMRRIWKETASRQDTTVTNLIIQAMTEWLSTQSTPSQ